MGSPFSHFLKGGFIGVDIFFVISGFLITSIISNEVSSGTFSFRGFYYRRAWRILPALIFVTLISIPFAWILLSPDRLAVFSQSLVGIGLFVSNVYFWLTSGYFSPAAEEQIMIHTWSLAVEEQYYIVFPLLFLMLWRRNKVFLGVSITLVMSLALAEFLGRVAPSAAFYFVFSRVWELLVGSLAGYYAFRYGLPDGRNGSYLWKVIGRNRNILGWFAAAGLIFSLIFYSSTLVIPGIMFLLPVGCAALLLICVYKDGLLYSALSARPMVGIGLISYSLYLFHQPVFAFLRVSQLDYPTLWQMLCALLAVVFLAWFSWAFVEQPFRKVKVNIWKTFLGLGGVVVGIVGLGLFGHLKEGFPSQRFNPVTVAAFESAVASPDRDRCHNRSPEGACHYNDETNATVFVVGDSHAVELAYGLSEPLSQQSIGTVHLSRSGCPPALTFETDVAGCSAWTEAVVEHLKNSSPGVVVFVYRHASYLFGVNDREKIKYPNLPNKPNNIQSGSSDDEKRRSYWASLEKMIELTRDAGHKVIVVQPFPEISRPIEAYLLHDAASASGSKTYTLPSVSRDYYIARSGKVRDRIDDFASKTDNVYVSDPMPVFCDEDTCYAVRDGVSLYFDDDHPSVAASTLFARNLLSDIGSASDSN